MSMGVTVTMSQHLIKPSFETSHADKRIGNNYKSQGRIVRGCWQSGP